MPIGRVRDEAKAEAKGVALTAIHLRVWRRQRGWGVTERGAVLPSRIAPRMPSARMVGRLEGLTGETLMSPVGLGGGGHKVPRTRGYLSKPDSPEKSIRPGGRQA